MWDIRYAFHWEEIAIAWGRLSVMKRKIHQHPSSPFNKQLLIARVLPDGTQSINDQRKFREWVEGREETIVFKNDKILFETVRSRFSPAIAREVERYKKSYIY